MLWSKKHYTALQLPEKLWDWVIPLSYDGPLNSFHQPLVSHFNCWCVVLSRLVVGHYMLVRKLVSRVCYNTETKARESGVAKTLFLGKTAGIQMGFLVRRVKLQMPQHEVDVG